jgi:hypothetical protein
MKSLGVKSYRMSLSWSRLIPSGRKGGAVNPKGVEFYNNVINELLKAGISPVVTLYHWDMPQANQDAYKVGAVVLLGALLLLDKGSTASLRPPGDQAAGSALRDAPAAALPNCLTSPHHHHTSTPLPTHPPPPPPPPQKNHPFPARACWAPPSSRTSTTLPTPRSASSATASRSG